MASSAGASVTLRTTGRSFAWTAAVRPAYGDAILRVRARYRAALPTGVPFVDRIGFAAIEREGVDFTLAADADFRATGTAVIP